MAPKSEQAERTKTKILSAVYEIVRREGPQGISANKIVTTAKISKGGLFHHFPQIEDLYLYMLDDLIRQMDEGLVPRDFPSLEKFIGHTTDFLILWMDQAPEIMSALYHFLSQSLHNPKYQERLKTMVESSFAGWAEKLSAYFTPALSKTKMQELVRLVDMYFSGLGLHYLIFKDPKFYRRLSKDFARMLQVQFTGPAPGSPVQLRPNRRTS